MSEYSRSNMASANSMPNFFSPQYTADTEDSNNPSARIPMSPFLNQPFDNNSPSKSPPTPFQQYNNNNNNNINTNYKTLRYSYPETAIPDNHNQNHISSSFHPSIYNEIYSIPERNKQIQDESKRKRRASQPHIYQTMMYEPINSPSNEANILPSFYTKRELNQLRMKYNEAQKHIKMKKKKRRHSIASNSSQREYNKNKPSSPQQIARSFSNYSHYTPTTTPTTTTTTHFNQHQHATYRSKKTQQQSIQTTTTKYEILNNYTNNIQQRYRSNNRYIDETLGSSSMSSISTPNTAQTPTYSSTFNNNNNKKKKKKSNTPIIMRYEKRTKISRRRSNTFEQIKGGNHHQYENKIIIKKRKKKKNKLERCKSYDNSYDHDGYGDDINDEDTEIIMFDNNNNNNNNNQKNGKYENIKSGSGSFGCSGSSRSSEESMSYNIGTVQKLKKKKKHKKKKKKGCKKHKKRSSVKSKSNEYAYTPTAAQIAKTRYSRNNNDDISESESINKQILRIREGKLGQRVVTFSRRKSLLNGKLIKSKTLKKNNNNNKNDIRDINIEESKLNAIPLISPLSQLSMKSVAFSTTDGGYLMDLQKLMEEEKKKLDAQRERMEDLLNKMQTEHSEQKNKLEKQRNELNEMKKKYEIIQNEKEEEYKKRVQELEKKEKEFEERQAVLLKDELDIDVNKHKLMETEKLINQQQHELVVQTEKFDTVISDFYVYQTMINATCNKHIELINKWRLNAQKMATNLTECTINPLQDIIENILQSAHLEDDDKNKFEEYRSEIEGIYNLSENILSFEDIDKLQDELKNMPRPELSKQEWTDCEMRLEDKWRDYLSKTYPDEYIDGSLPQHIGNDCITEISDTQELLNDYQLIEEQEEDDDDSKMPELKMIENIMKLPVTTHHDENKQIDNNEEEENHSFTRNKHKHRRSSASFIKTPSFLDNLHPFWSLQYDSGNEDDIDHDLSRNSNSSAVIHDDHNEDDHDIIDIDT